jgi:hypothetical protein
MPTIAWVLVWVAVIAVVAFFTIREVRAKRRGPADIDRLRHPAAGEADMRAHTQGPNGFGQGYQG